MGVTNIQWADYTFNPWLGCRKVAPECANCYIVDTPPFKFRGIVHGGARVRTAESTWKQPLSWNRAAAKAGERRRVFCLSLGDWLDDENVPIEWLADLLKLIHATPHLDWLLLTKRPQNWRARLMAVLRRFEDDPAYRVEAMPKKYCQAVNWLCGDTPPNVWIGVSAGADQAAALAIPAKVHFLSCEPMLKPLDTENAAWFNWIIFGGESGKNARTVALQWLRDGVAFCRVNGVAPFVKQLGSNFRVADLNGRLVQTKLIDSHGGDMEEWPEDLRVREFPTV